MLLGRSELPSDGPLSFQTPTSRKPRSSTSTAGRGGTWAPSTQSCRTCRGLWWPTLRKSYSAERHFQVRSGCSLVCGSSSPRPAGWGEHTRGKGFLIPGESNGLWVLHVGMVLLLGENSVSLPQVALIPTGQAPEHCRQAQGVLPCGVSAAPEPLAQLTQHLGITWLG